MKNSLICLILFFGLISSTTQQQLEAKSKGLTGTYRSLKGVMHPYSCYGYNVGILTKDNGDEVPVYFKDESIDISCERIRLKGKLVEMVNEPEDSSPCASGKMTFYVVKSYTCL